MHEEVEESEELDHEGQPLNPDLIGANKALMEGDLETYDKIMGG